MKITEAMALGPLTNIRAGGSAAKFFEASSEDELVDALGWAERHREKSLILGGGSNLVVSDRGVDGLVIKLSSRGVDVQPHDTGVEVTASAGEPWDDLVALSVENGWSGLECLSGIPGLVGASPIQNVGAYGQDVSETIKAVRAYDRAQRAVVELGAEACRFSYRDSLFKSLEPNRYVVTAVTFILKTRTAVTVSHPDVQTHLNALGIERPTLQSVRDAVLAVRKRKSMVLDPLDPDARSCGSFFVNPIVDGTLLEAIVKRLDGESMPRWPVGARTKLSAAWLIQAAGFSLGERRGSAGLSKKHALAIVAHGEATATDVVALAREIRTGVEEKFGVRLVPEPRFWGFEELDDGLPEGD